MRRRLLALVVFAASMVLTGPAGAEPDHPNILLIIADDVGAEMIGKHPNANPSPASTPTLDALANAGVMFTNVWSNPLCGTTRATIMTGRYAHRTGIAWAGGTLSLAQVTIPEKLASAGYKSAIVGKWGLVASFVASENSSHPVRSGFDYFSGSPSTQLETPDGPSNYFYWRKYFGRYDAQRPNCDGTHDDIDCVDTTGSPVLIGDEEPGEEPDAEEPGDYATTVNVNDALAWVDGLDEESPWFLVLAFNAAHATFHAPPFDLHEMQLTYNTADRRCVGTHIPACYRAMIKAMDAEIGRLRDELTSMGEWNDTVVIFVGDNGTPSGLGASTLGSKSTLFEGGVNVPLIVSGPDVLPSGIANTERESQALVNTSDLFMTVLDLANVDTTLGVDHDSYSQVPVIAGMTDGIRNFTYAEVGGINDQIDDGIDKNGWGSAKAIRSRWGFKLHRRRDDNGALSWYFHYLANPETAANNLLQGVSSLALKAPYSTNPLIVAARDELVDLLGDASLSTPAPLAPDLPPVNPDDQDADGVVADNCPSVPNPGQQDADSDGVGDACDNCRTLAQDSSQRCDTDKDGYGNLCDGDFDNDGLTIPADFDIWNVDFTTTGTDSGKKGTDMNCDGFVDSADFPHWNDQFQETGVPGPSGLLCAGQRPCGAL